MSNATPAAWTPSTDSRTLPRAERCELAGPQRVYFYDLDTRAELAHPLAGMRWTGGGPMVSHEGAYVDGTVTAVSGAAFIDGVWRRVRVTPESFPGRKIAAKIWYGPEAPAELKPEWRVLARGDDSRVLGQRPRIGREWIALFTAGAVA